MKAVAEHALVDYSEPAYCTASREMHEETGLEVIVGSLLDNSTHFAAFRCYLMAEPPKELKTFDPKEVKGRAWVPLSELVSHPERLRFAGNLDIMKKLTQ